MSHAWQAGWLRGWLAGWLRPREAQRGGAWIELAFHVLGWRLPQADLRPGRLPTDISMCGTREEAPADYHDVQSVPNRNPRQPHGIPIITSSTTECPHKQNYDQGGSPQAELKPGSLPGWLVAGWGRKYYQGTCHSLGRLGGWLGGWLAG